MAVNEVHTEGLQPSVFRQPEVGAKNKKPLPQVKRFAYWLYIDYQPLLRMKIFA